MDKKFVPLTSNQSPSKNPYEIRTYVGESTKQLPDWHSEQCVYERNCAALQTSTIGKILMLQDEIRKIHQRTRENIFLRPFSKNCQLQDRFTACVVPQRTPEQLRLHAIMREKTLKVEYELKQRLNDAGNLYSEHDNLVQLDDPGLDEDENSRASAVEGVKPEPATPDCSREIIYVAPKKLLALKRPKSGILVNETERPKSFFDDDVYNPRVLQQQFDAQYLKNIDLIPCKNGGDMWTWNVGLQKKESELDRIFIEAAIPKFDCNNLELAVYKIPKDLHKTFSAVIIFGTKAIRPPPITGRKPNPRRPIEIACLYIAFVEGFRLNADFWRSETLDNIIEMAGNLIAKSVRLNYISIDNDYDIIPQISERQAAVNIKVHFAGPLKNEPNIYKALSVYFSRYNACILCSNNLFLLIWKRCKNFFYVYDPNGRMENCTRDFQKGKSALLSTHFVEHLVHFIVNISRTNLNDEFKLYEIFLTSYGKAQGQLPKNKLKKSTHKQWAVVNESYAVIPGCNNGIFQPTTSTVDNPSMLISLMAILYSHIDEASSWRPDQVDELIRLGTAYYKSLRRKLNLKDSQHVTIIDLPDKYVLGNFKASLKKSPFMYTGTVTDFCKRYKDSLLASGVQELFENNWDAALLQIDNSVLGIWRDKDLFYVFDPFRRGKAGQVLDPDDYRSQGAAILQIHANVESLLRILYESSLKIRRGGKLFIHAINVGCIKPIMDGKQRKLRYPKLKLTPEIYTQPDENQQVEEEEKSNKKSKRKPNKICSIETLGRRDLLMEIKSFEVVEPVLEEVLCDVLLRCPEPVVGHPKLYKSAARVLLRSDKDYLEHLKYMLKRGEDYDNMEMSYRTEPEQQSQMISLEEELQVPSNFEPLPDGTWIIRGSLHVDGQNDEQFKLMGLLSSIVTAVLTEKYKVSTWTKKLVDYAVGQSDHFGEEFQTYHYALAALLEKKVPGMLLGDRTYRLLVEAIIKSDIRKPLREVLIETLINFNRIIVICQRFCCLIVKRLNFLYMFCGFPTNSVGFRNQTLAPGCMMRFVELDSVIRRIEFGCNPHGCDISNYVVIPLKVWDVTEGGRYRSWPRNVEEQMYNEALDEKSRMEESKRSKMRFLNEELARENLRIKEFEAERAKASEGKASQAKSSGETTIQENRSEAQADEFNEEGLEEESQARPKHDFDSDAQTIKNEDNLSPHPVVYGYRMRQTDLLYKIQGSKALDGRNDCIQNEHKSCIFASALAILYAILKPLNEWTSHRIDQVIDSALLLSEHVDDMSIVPERIVTNVSVDDYVFDIVLKTYDPLGLGGRNLEKQLERVLSLNKYIILHTSNCAYAIVKSMYYDLFDPYASMSLMSGRPPPSSPQQKHPKSIKRYRERNTASWVLFADIKSMLDYINERACTDTWQKDREYRFIVLEITSFKKAAQSAYLLQLLTGMQTCNVDDEYEASICAHNESIAWLEHCLPIWSRLNRRNAAGQYRGTTVSKLKNYDIEIDRRLWSLWGSLHPQAPVFDDSTRGKQYLACCVISLCAASIYRLVDWSPHILDSIIINGDRYLNQSLQTISRKDYQLNLEDLDVECTLDSIKFTVHIEMVAYGKLYSRPYYDRMNLAEALIYFFSYFQFGILQCFKKCLAIGLTPGKDGGYFMFDCQSRDNPLFPNGQGSSYILRTKYLQILLYCIVVTLNISYYNVQFTLHKVNVQLKDQQH